MLGSLRGRVGRVVGAVGVLAGILVGSGLAPVFSSAASGQTPTSVETDAVNWAIGQIGSTSYYGLCLTLVREAYQDGANFNIEPLTNYGTFNGTTYAQQVWDDGFNSGTTGGNNTTPPYGALVFFTDPSNYTYGHVMISLGGGNNVSAPDAYNESAVHYESLTEAANSPAYAKYAGWWLPDGTTGPPPPPTNLQSISAVLQPDGSQNVYYVGSNGQMFNWYYSPASGWSNAQLGTGETVEAGTAISAVLNPDGSQNVYYVGSNGQLWNWYFTSTGWSDVQLGSGVSAVANSGVSGLIQPDGSQNVYYVGSNGQMFNWYYSPASGWSNVQLVDAPTQAPSITSGSSANFTVGFSQSFEITYFGTPVPTLSESGGLPNGITFNDNGNGTATLSGTPAEGSGGSYPLTITASNGVGSPATQSFTLTVAESPTISSLTETTFVVGESGSFSVATSTGYPIPAIAETGNLPPGVSFTDNGNGNATLAGTPAPGSAGIYPVTITTSNGVPPDATQSFTLTVLPMAITTRSLPTGTVKTPYSATLTAVGGNPPYKWSLAPGSGPLPPGLKLKPTGVISGKLKKAGTYSFAVQVVDTKTKAKPHTQNSATQTLSITIS
jgi:Putative Ig domain